jgi:protein-disulfide isomerase
LDLTGAPVRGSKSAKVALVEFSDFQCPFCAAFARNTLPDLNREFIDSGRVLMAFRHFPLDRIHANARSAAQAADCAGEQNTFWEMHNRIFANQSQLSASDFLAYASAIGLDQQRFRACLARSPAPEIAADMALAQDLSVTGTPTFFVGAIQPNGQVAVRKRISGAQPLQQFRRAIEEVEAGLSGGQASQAVRQ